MSDVTLYNLGPSPNSKKVRLALGYKGIAHRKIDINPEDRASVVEVSGQPLTPVLVHGKNVIFDSSAILRYIDANISREPRLFSADYGQMKAIEKWEGFAKSELGPHVGACFGQFFSGNPDSKVTDGAAKGVNEAARKIDSELASRRWLVGDTMTAADITCAAWLGLAQLSESEATVHPIMTFFKERLGLDTSLAHVSEWYQRVNQHDRA